MKDKIKQIKDKIRQISKYVMNIMAMINALIKGLSPIWNWHLDKISDSIVVIIGIIGLYLVGGKLFEEKDEDTHALVEDHEVK